MAIEVVPYDPGWPVRFERIRGELADALGGVPVRAIEHVGSTAVPGLAAKPVIDVDILVTRADLWRAIRALEHAGYSHRGDLGIPDRHSMSEPDPPRRNVYVVVDGSLALRNHLAVRDALRANGGLRDQYARLKEELGARLDTVDEYSAAKTDFLVGILERAGFTGEEIETVAIANRAGPA
jgi:GrpB-like predicted nucleotidyltransferase (UPF0157 family)